METAPLDISFYKQALIILGAAAVVIPLLHRLHVSSVLGFMLVGIAVGRFGLASLTPHLPWLSAITIGRSDSIEPVAHLGVVLLLFLMEPPAVTRLGRRELGLMPLCDIRSTPTPVASWAPTR